MSKFIIQGGNKLRGEISVNGAKNAALLAISIMSLCNSALQKKLEDYKMKMERDSMAKNDKIEI